MSPEQKTIVVTGGAGFVGSRLCGRLAPRGHRVISVDNYFTGVRGIEVPGVDYREAHTNDIGAAVPERPDIVFHLGEYSRVEASLAEPDVVWDMNVNGTFQVLEYWREKSPKLVYAGSSTKFADGGLGRDQSPYAFTKATNSELVRNYGDWYGLPFAITYFYNVYGPGERAGTYGTLIEIFRQRFLAGEELPGHLAGDAAADLHPRRRHRRRPAADRRARRGRRVRAWRRRVVLDPRDRRDVRLAGRDAARGAG